MTLGSAEGNDIGRQHLLHRRQHTQGMLPLPTIITSTDGGILGYDIGQNSSLLHRRRRTKGLLPLLALPTSTDGGIVGNDIG